MVRNNIMVLNNDIARYPHMLPEERRIWSKFITGKERNYLKLTYDLHLGYGVFPPYDASPQLKAVIESTSRKRVDAIGESVNQITIFEVKPRGGMSAMGQLLTYKDLYVKEYRPTKPIKLALVCERLEPDVSSTLQANGIEIFIV